MWSALYLVLLRSDAAASWTARRPLRFCLLGRGGWRCSETDPRRDGAFWLGREPRREPREPRLSKLVRLLPRRPMPGLNGETIDIEDLGPVAARTECTH